MIGDILGVAVKDEEQGLMERARLKANGLNPNMFKYYSAPHMFKKYELDQAIKNGKRPPEVRVGLSQIAES